MWFTYLTVHLCIYSNYSNLKILCVLQNRQLLDYCFAIKLSTDHAFLANVVKIENNLKTQLIKANESFGGGTGGKFQSFIDKSLNASHRAE